MRNFMFWFQVLFFAALGLGMMLQGIWAENEKQAFYAFMTAGMTPVLIWLEWMSHKQWKQGYRKS